VAVSDLLHSAPVAATRAGLRLLPLIDPEQGLANTATASYSSVLQSRVKGYDGTTACPLALYEIARKSFIPQQIVFSKGNSSVLVADEICIRVESLEIRYLPFL